MFHLINIHTTARCVSCVLIVAVNSNSFCRQNLPFDCSEDAGRLLREGAELCNVKDCIPSACFERTVRQQGVYRPESSSGHSNHERLPALVSVSSRDLMFAFYEIHTL